MKWRLSSSVAEELQAVQFEPDICLGNSYYYSCYSYYYCCSCYYCYYYYWYYSYPSCYYCCYYCIYHFSFLLANENQGCVCKARHLVTLRWGPFDLTKPHTHKPRATQGLHRVNPNPQTPTYWVAYQGLKFNY